MQDIEHLVDPVELKSLQFTLDPNSIDGDPIKETLLDAVQLPIAALALLCLSADFNGQLRAASMGMYVGVTLVHAYPQFKQVGRRLEWSLRVRRVCADALDFLESAKLVEVENSQREGRLIRISRLGRSFLQTTKASERDVVELTQRLTAAAATARNHVEGVLFL